MSRTAGNNWSRGYKTYRHGQVVGFVPALDRLAVRRDQRPVPVPGRADRDRRPAPRGLSIRQIAARLGRAPSTISRELRRNATAAGATGRSRLTAARPRVGPAITGDASTPTASCGQVVGELLAQRWSPQQISRHLRPRFPDEPGMWLCHESIYQAVYQPGSPLLRPSPLAPHRRSPLRTGRDHRRAHQRADRRRPRFEQPMLTIHQRPVPARGPLRGRALGGRSHHRQGPGLGDRHPGRAADQDGPAAAPAPARRRHPARRAEGADGRPAAGAAAVDHLGPGHRDGPPSARSPDRSARRSTSATPTRPGSAARTRTPTGCCATTSPRAPT